MAKIIIGIHGLGNKPQASLLEEWWIRSIKEGFEKNNHPITDFKFRMVYWADILYAKAENLTITDKENKLFITEPYIPSSNLPVPEREDSFSSKILKYIGDQLDNIFLKEDMTLNFAGVTDRIIYNYFKDLEIYYSHNYTTQDDPNRMARPAICNRLFKVLMEHKDDEIMLIAHSMGSIVAYDVLVNHLLELKIDTFVTVGSPLGLPIIISRIFAEQKEKLSRNQLVAPDNILKKWINISDPADLVAMDHTLNDDFIANKHGIQAEDINVYNDYMANEKHNPHKIYGYLRCPEMTDIINTFLFSPSENIMVKHLKRVKAKIKGLFT